MTTLRAAAQQALAAWFQPHGINYVDFRPYMEALRTALAEPEQEPVAWIDIEADGTRHGLRMWSEGGSSERALYTHPALQPVTLTDREIDAVTIKQWGVMAGALAMAHRAYARAVIEAYQRKQEGKV